MFTTLLRHFCLQAVLVLQILSEALNVGLASISITSTVILKLIFLTSVLSNLNVKGDHLHVCGSRCVDVLYVHGCVGKVMAVNANPHLSTSAALEYLHNVLTIHLFTDYPPGLGKRMSLLTQIDQDV